MCVWRHYFIDKHIYIIYIWESQILYVHYKYSHGLKLKRAATFLLPFSPAHSVLFLLPFLQFFSFSLDEHTINPSLSLSLFLPNLCLIIHGGEFLVLGMYSESEQQQSLSTPSLSLYAEIPSWGFAAGEQHPGHRVDGLLLRYRNDLLCMCWLCREGDQTPPWDSWSCCWCFECQSSSPILP